jgi:glycosyltransferase involved in cell wall biosynthesis
VRFCMITTFYPPYHFGGDATYVRALARGLVAEGHEVEVIHCEDAYLIRGEAPSHSIDNEDGVVVHRLRSHFGILSPLISQQTGHPGLKKTELEKLLNNNFDVIHFHNISLMGGPAILKMSAAPVTLYTLHEHWLVCPTHILWKNKTMACDVPECINCCLKSGVPPQLWRYTSLLEKSIDNVDCLLSPSKFTAEQHKSISNGARIEVLPLFSYLDPKNTVDEVNHNRPQFLFVGRVTKSKGIIELLAFFAKLPEYDLLVVGAGELLAELKLEYARFSNISFVNRLPQQELVELYQQSMALIFPSLAPETFGLTIVEAFACGTPAIVRDAGASRELIDQTGAGFVYNNDEELKSSIVTLVENQKLRASLAQKSRESYEKYFTAKIHIENYLNIIKDIQLTHNTKAQCL